MPRLVSVNVPIPLDDLIDAMCDDCNTDEFLHAIKELSEYVENDKDYCEFIRQQFSKLFNVDTSALVE